MGVSQMDSTIKLEADMHASAMRAGTLLKILLNAGHVPAQHVSHVREVVEQHEKARSAYLNALTGVAHA